MKRLKISCKINKYIYRMQILSILFFSGAASGYKKSLAGSRKKLLFAQAAVKKRCYGAPVHAASDKD